MNHMKDTDPQDEKDFQEMLSYYRTGRKMFWIIVSLGMLAGAITAIIVFIDKFRR